MHISFIIIGYISSVITTIAFIPQIITVFINKSGKNISYPYLLIILLELILYVTYGLGFILDKNLDAIPIILGGGFQLILLLILCGLKIYFKIIKKKKVKKHYQIVNQIVNQIIFLIKKHK